MSTVLSVVGGPLSAGLHVKLSAMARGARRCGWEITYAEIDAASRAVRIEATQGLLCAPARRVILSGSWDRSHLERFMYRRGQEPRGRRGDRYMSETCEVVFLGRTSGHLRDTLRTLGAYFADNDRPLLNATTSVAIVGSAE